MLGWYTLAGIPLLVLGNKNDLEGALTEEELIEELNLGQIQHRAVACFSISSRDVVGIDITVNWLSELPKKKKKKTKH